MIQDKEIKKDWIIEFVSNNEGFTFSSLPIFIEFDKKFYSQLDKSIYKNTLISERQFKYLVKELVEEYRLIKRKTTYYNDDINKTLTENDYDVK